jgi:hypothetical protein
VGKFSFVYAQIFNNLNEPEMFSQYKSQKLYVVKKKWKKLLWNLKAPPVRDKLKNILVQNGMFLIIFIGIIIVSIITFDHSPGCHLTGQSRTLQDCLSCGGGCGHM